MLGLPGLPSFRRCTPAPVAAWEPRATPDDLTVVSLEVQEQPGQVLPFLMSAWRAPDSVGTGVSQDSNQGLLCYKTAQH